MILGFGGFFIALLNGAGSMRSDWEEIGALTEISPSPDLIRIKLSNSNSVCLFVRLSRFVSKQGYSLRKFQIVLLGK
jgi:hypothetical protein